MATAQKSTKKTKQQSIPACTIEDRENQLIALAVDLAEKQLREGTASSQVISHYLKLGTTREKLEIEKLKQETELLKAKEKQIESTEKNEQSYLDAIEAMRRYSGNGSLNG